MASDYEYEVFVSYRRSLDSGKPSAERTWVQKVLHPALEQWLAVYSPKARVFIDTDLETGVHWPENLKHNLLHSKCLVPVWSAGYFRSRWCMAEWHSMLEREKRLGLGEGEKRGLVIPIVFGDGDFFPERAQQTQDLRRFHDYGTITRPKGKRYEKLLTEMNLLCQDLAAYLDSQCPPFDPDWPTLEVEALDAPHVPLEGLG